MDSDTDERSAADSVFSCVSSICRHFSTGLGDDTVTREFIFRELRKVAWSCILKKRKPAIQPFPTLDKDLPLELCMCIAQRQSQSGEWTSKDFDRVTSLIERFEAITTNNQYPWLVDMGKMLLLLATHLSCKEVAISEPPSSTGVEEIPYPFRLLKPSRFRVNFFDDRAQNGFMYRMVETRIEQMKTTPSLLWAPNLLDGVYNTHWIMEFKRRQYLKPPPRPCDSRSSSSSPYTDEGFSSPSRRDQLPRPIEWSTVSSTFMSPLRQWETIEEKDPIDLTAFEFPWKNRKGRNGIQLSPCRLVRVDRKQLIVSVKALLTGLPSDIFPSVGLEFAMKPGLYTDGKTPNVMFIICKPLRRAGELFTRLEQPHDGNPCTTSATMNSVIKNYLLDYQAMVLSIPDDAQISELAVEIGPFIEQLDYLVKLREQVLGINDVDGGGRLQGWRLLQKLFSDLLWNGDPDLDKLISGIFLDCCQVYFRFIDAWIFEGKWHPDLFFQQIMTAEKVEDRYSWIKMFSFSPNNAPGFLPAKSIFECGRMVHLVRNMFMIEESHCSRECRPHVNLLTNKMHLDSVKRACQFYSHTGDDLRLAVRRIFTKNEDEDLLRIALETAAANSSKYIEAKGTEKELKMDIQRKNLSMMKEELRRYEHHRNIEKLKTAIYELMQDDQIMLSQLRQVIASSSLRFELIERYVNELDKITRKTLLNTWKERRYGLAAVREKYFADLQNNRWLTPEYISNEHVCLTPRTQFTDATGSQVYTARSSFGSRPVTPSTVDSTSTSKYPTPAGLELTGSEVDAAQSSFSSRYVTPHSRFDSSTASKDGNPTPDCPEPPGNPDSYQPKLSYRNAMREIASPAAGAIGRRQPSSPSDMIFDAVEEHESPRERSLLEFLDSSYADEKSIENEPENPPLCCMGDAFDDTVISHDTPPSSDADSQTSHKPQDTFDRMICHYKRKVRHGTLNPFTHIERYKDREMETAAVDENTETSEISPAEFSKSFLSYLMKKSVSYPLEAQNKALNNLILHKFFVENKFLEHLKRLRDVFLRHDGVSAVSLTKLISGKIERESPETFLVYPKLQNILSLSFHADADNISLKAGIAAPIAFDITDPNVMSCLRITYVNEWPLKLILTDKAISKYNDAFQFLFSVDRTLWYVREASQQLKSISKMVAKLSSQLHLHLHVMLVVLNAIKLYTGFCVTSCWENFETLLENVKCPEKLYRVHVKFIKNIIYKFMLVKQMSRFHEGLTKVLHYALVYCQTLKLCDWHLFTSDLQYLTSKSKKLNLTFENFTIMVEGTCNVLDYYIKQRGHEHLKMLHQSMILSFKKPS